MTRHENIEVMKQLYAELHQEFGSLAPRIIKVFSRVAGGCRLTVPDLKKLYLQERNRLIKNEFHGDPRQYEELGFKYRLHPKHVRRIVQEE